MGWFLLHLSSNMKSAVQLFPWDPGGQEDIAIVQIYILVPQLFRIFVLNNKGEPRCKRLNLTSCQVSLWQLEDELVLKGGGDVMGSQQAAAGPIGPRVISLAVKLGQGLGLVSSLYKERQVCHLEGSNTSVI
jgi:hypothetical protein